MKIEIEYSRTADGPEVRAVKVCGGGPITRLTGGPKFDAAVEHAVALGAGLLPNGGAIDLGDGVLHLETEAKD